VHSASLSSHTTIFRIRLLLPSYHKLRKQSMIMKLFAIAIVVSGIVTTGAANNSKNKHLRCKGKDAVDLLNPGPPCYVRECRAMFRKKWKEASGCIRAPTCDELRNSNNKRHRWFSNMCDKEGATECFQVRSKFPFALTTSRRRNTGDSTTCKGNMKWNGFCVINEATNGTKVEIGLTRRTTLTSESEELFAVASFQAGCSGLNSGFPLRPYNNKCGDTLAARLLPLTVSALNGELTLRTMTTSDGLARRYYIFRSFFNLNPDLGSSAAPLVVDLHGASQCPELSALYSGWLEIAARENMVLVWPEGTQFSGTFLGDFNPFITFWNTNTLRWVDDVGFLREMIKDIQDNDMYNIDLSRLYMAGFSNGSAMAQTFAFIEQNMTAGVAGHSGFLPVRQEAVLGFITEGLLLPSSISNGGWKLASPVPIINVHGLLDPIVPYFDTGNGRGAVENTHLWADINECTGYNIDIFSGYKIESYVECGGGAEVKLLTVEGAGHFPFEGADTDIATTKLAWEFIKHFSKS